MSAFKKKKKKKAFALWAIASQFQLVSVCGVHMGAEGGAS